MVEAVKDLVVAGVRVSIVSYEQFTDGDFIPPATFYIRSALDDYYFFHTRDRAKAQEACDEYFDGVYTVRASKTQKGKGSVTCTGTQTTRGQRR